MFGNTSGLLKHSVVVPENVFLKYVFQMGGGGLRGEKFMFSQEASNFSFFNPIQHLAAFQGSLDSLCLVGSMPCTVRQKTRLGALK